MGDNGSKQFFAELIDGFDLVKDGHKLSSSVFPIEIDLLHLSRRLINDRGWVDFIDYFMGFYIGRFLEGEQVIDDLYEHAQKHNKSYGFTRWGDRYALIQDLEDYSEQLALREGRIDVGYGLFLSKFTPEYIASVKPKLRPTKQLKSQLISIISTSHDASIFNETINLMSDVSNTLDNISWKHEKWKELEERRKVYTDIIKKFCDLLSFDEAALELRENPDIKESLMSILYEQLENFIERCHNALAKETNSGLIEMLDDIPVGPSRDLLIGLTEREEIGMNQKGDYGLYFSCLMKFEPQGERFESLVMNLIQKTDFQTKRMWEIVWSCRQNHVQAFASIWEFIHSLDDESKALGIQTLSISTNGIEKSEDFENIIMYLDGTNTVLRDIAAESLTKTTDVEFDEKAWPLILREN